MGLCVPQRSHPPVTSVYFCGVLAYWAIQSPRGCRCADWDESNAFCNVSKEALSGYLMDGPPPHEHVGTLTKWFIDGRIVYL